jgi:NADPH-dependent curcumin reductase CurA
LADDDFAFVDAPVTPPGDGEVLLRTLYLELAPAQKSWMENLAGYRDPLAIGDVMSGNGSAVVIESRHPGFVVGDLVTGLVGWSEYPTLSGARLAKVTPGVSPTAALSVLGTSGRTAYAGLLLVGEAKPGDVVLISGAAGAVGTLVGQIAKLCGCTVIGIAGGAEKCRWLVEEVGFDAAIDYRTEKVRARLRELAPGGVDIFYDNVGGDILNDALTRIAPGARVVICGAIARYNHDPRDPARMPEGPRNYFNLVATGAKMQGFIVHQFAHRFAAIDRRLAAWLKIGAIVPHEDVQTGFENAPATLRRLFDGTNRGKQLLQVSAWNKDA